MQPPASSPPATRHTTPADTCHVDVTTVAFFFDLDGTLAPLAPRPDAVRLPLDTANVLASLFHRARGAIAVVSGRAIDDIDGLLAPLRVPAAGLHGAEIRHADGERVRAEGYAVDTERIASMIAPLHALVAQHPGLLLENKGSALALQVAREELVKRTAAGTGRSKKRWHVPSVGKVECN